MPVAKLAKSKPDPISDRAAAALCKEWAALDEERLRLNREAEAAERRQKKIEAELVPFVKATKTGRLPVRELTKFRLEIVQWGNWFGLKDALIDEIGQEEFDRRREAVGTHDKLRITSTAAATKTAKPRAA